MSYRDAVGGMSFKDTVGKSLHQTSGGTFSSPQGIVIDIPKDSKAFQEWFGKALIGRCVNVATLTKLNSLLEDATWSSDSSEPDSDTPEELEDDQTAGNEQSVADVGTLQNRNEGSIPQVDLNCEPHVCGGGGPHKDVDRVPKVRELGQIEGNISVGLFKSVDKEKRPIMKSAILRPKKANSPLEDTRPKKRSRAESEDLFGLEMLLGFSLFGDNTLDRDLEEGEIREPDLEPPDRYLPPILDLNSLATPTVSDSLNHMATSMDERVVDSFSEQAINEIEATVIMGEVVGTHLGNHSDLVKQIIHEEGNNVVT
ncbi:hypothetical protein L1987_71465 [Smallanthus sonchifolius]|uniref:Uncharacterized protein n=1 Tax=Smallanthus sonchifolius TaxID=185202 RepID=A0ACB9ASI4_9ASTR|nr:hypothetical protein L1987_71465 [Smallanthus sonchifolius]